MLANARAKTALRLSPNNAVLIFTMLLPGKLARATRASSQAHAGRLHVQRKRRIGTHGRRRLPALP